MGDLDCSPTTGCSQMVKLHLCPSENCLFILGTDERRKPRVGVRWLWPGLKDENLIGCGGMGDVETISEKGSILLNLFLDSSICTEHRTLKRGYE